VIEQAHPDAAVQIDSRRMTAVGLGCVGTFSAEAFTAGDLGEIGARGNFC
jgi:hypothetical protein